MKTEMPKSDTSGEIKVTTRILPGPPVTQQQKTLFRKFFAKVIAEVKKGLPPNQAPANDALTGSTEESSSRE